MRALVVVTTGIVMALTAMPASSQADAYEPNDSLLSASGPLLAGSTYSAVLEHQGDRDIFFFYMTSRERSSAQLTVSSVGGGAEITDLSVKILDATGVAVVGQNYIRAGEERLIVASLEPQKYYVEVATGEGFGDSYRLTPEGGPGAFGPYEQIAGRCAAWQQATMRARQRLGMAEARRGRALARIRRARYKGYAARNRARVAFRRARRLLRSKRRALRVAAGRRDPWCSIES